mgnify:CR=1 FL=1
MDYTKLQNGSDIRGVAMEGIEGQHVNLTEQACRDIGRGFALWLRARLGKDTLRVAVGRDSRLSGPQLALWLMEAMAAEGLQVTDLGMASTPAMFMSTVTEGFAFDASVMITASHLPFNRNGVLFPRKINGRFAMLSRPSDNGHTAFGDIFYSESPDMEFWGRHRHVMSPAAFEVSAWQCMKIGAGPVPIETSEGWLLLYHGVLRSCNGYVYAFGSALLDLDQPWKTIARSGPYLISPREIYELTGDVPNVTFPCASLHDPETGRIAVYYGCADTVTGLAFGYIPEIIDFTKQNSIL